MIDWFGGRLGYDFDPVVHGTASEWLSDLISISFNEPPKHFKRSMRTLKVAILCRPSDHMPDRAIWSLPQDACCIALLPE